MCRDIFVTDFLIEISGFLADPYTDHAVILAAAAAAAAAGQHSCCEYENEQ